MLLKSWKTVDNDGIGVNQSLDVQEVLELGDLELLGNWVVGVVLLQEFFLVERRGLL